MTARGKSIDSPATAVASDDALAPEEPPSIQAGFVRCVHPETDGAADLPEIALGIWRARGWIPADEAVDETPAE
jgi:hypothetical protein